MIHFDQRYLWLMIDFPALLELRNEGLISIDHTEGSSAYCELELDIYFELKNDINFLRSLNIQSASILQVTESSRLASEQTANSWMGN